MGIMYLNGQGAAAVGPTIYWCQLQIISELENRKLESVSVSTKY